jgi:hypothetical protein
MHSHPPSGYINSASNSVAISTSPLIFWFQSLAENCGTAPVQDTIHTDNGAGIWAKALSNTSRVNGSSREIRMARNIIILFNPLRRIFTVAIHFSKAR